MSVVTDQDLTLPEAVADDLALIEARVVGKVHLADLIRAGSKDTTQAHGWGEGNSACALSAAALAARQMGLI